MLCVSNKLISHRPPNKRSSPSIMKEHEICKASGTNAWHRWVRPHNLLPSRKKITEIRAVWFFFTLIIVRRGFRVARLNGNTGIQHSHPAGALAAVMQRATQRTASRCPSWCQAPPPPVASRCWCTPGLTPRASPMGPAPPARRSPKCGGGT